MAIVNALDIPQYCSAASFSITAKDPGTEKWESSNPTGAGGIYLISRSPEPLRSLVQGEAKEMSHAMPKRSASQR